MKAWAVSIQYKSGMNTMGMGLGSNPSCVTAQLLQEAHRSGNVELTDLVLGVGSIEISADFLATAYKEVVAAIPQSGGEQDERARKH